MGTVTRKRHLLKSVTWRIIATITTVLLVLLFTGDFELSIKFGIVEVILKFALYYIHERVWYKQSKFGVKK